MNRRFFASMIVFSFLLLGVFGCSTEPVSSEEIIEPKPESKSLKASKATKEFEPVPLELNFIPILIEYRVGTTEMKKESVRAQMRASGYLLLFHKCDFPNVEVWHVRRLNTSGTSSKPRVVKTGDEELPSVPPRKVIVGSWVNKGCNDYDGVDVRL